MVNGNGNSITELNASSGSLVRVINAKADQFRDPDGIALNKSRAWIVNYLGDSVTELNSSNGSLVRVIK